jgi:tetrathionate reductase subunit A
VEPRGGQPPSQPERPVLERHPALLPPQLADGTPLNEAFKPAQWPLLLTSYKSHTMSSMSIGSDRLRQVNPSNRVRLNAQTAAQLGIESGDRVRVSTPDGSVIGVAECVAGVQADAIAIEHGFGHKELGAREHWIDGRKWLPIRCAEPGSTSTIWRCWIPAAMAATPWWTGPSARRPPGLPARVEKLV